MNALQIHLLLLNPDIAVTPSSRLWRGIRNALLLSVPLWAALFALGWWIAR